MTKILIQFLLFLTLLFSFGCGGGGGGGGGGETYTKATISFSLISTSTLPFRMNGVQVTAILPDGLDVATSGTVISSGLEAGSATNSAVTASVPITGTYSGPNQVILLIGDSSNTQTGFGPGEIVRLTCSIAPGAKPISESDQLKLEEHITFKASGWDPSPTAATNPGSLNDFLKSKIDVKYSK